MATIDPDEILFDLDQAESFRLPSVGRHRSLFQRAELGRNNKDTHDMITLMLALAQDDPDAPNFPVRFYLMLPNPGDKEVMWGTRSAFGSMMDKIKKTLTAFGGQESGQISKSGLMTFLMKHEGEPVKVVLTQTLRRDVPEGADKNDPNNLTVNVDGLEAA